MTNSHVSHTKECSSSARIITEWSARWRINNALNSTNISRPVSRPIKSWDTWKPPNPSILPTATTAETSLTSANSKSDPCINSNSSYKIFNFITHLLHLKSFNPFSQSIFSTKHLLKKLLPTNMHFPYWISIASSQKIKVFLNLNWYHHCKSFDKLS